MKKWIKHRWILGLVAAAATVVSYAQFANPADEVPAYHPAAPLRFAPLPPIMAGNQLTIDDERKKLELVGSVARRAWSVPALPPVKRSQTDSPWLQ